MEQVGVDDVESLCLDPVPAAPDGPEVERPPYLEIRHGAPRLPEKTPPRLGPAKRRHRRLEPGPGKTAGE